MRGKKFAALLCILGLVCALPPPEPVRTAGSPLEVELDSPPLVALTFDDGPRSSTTGGRPRPPFSWWAAVSQATRTWSGGWRRRDIRSASTPMTM